MDITVYLPDELGARAKSAKLPFSQLFRAAVERELAERNAESLAIEQLVSLAPRGSMSLIYFTAEGVGEPIPESVDEGEFPDGRRYKYRHRARWRDVRVTVRLDDTEVDLPIEVDEHGPADFDAAVRLMTAAGPVRIGEVSLFVDDHGRPSSPGRIWTLARDLGVTPPDVFSPTTTQED